MRTGAEIKVGLITVLAVVLVAAYVFYVRGYRAPAMVYRVSVVFEDASGLQRGDTVRLAGVKIGEVKSVAINKQLKAQADLTIDQRYDLYDSYTFQIVTSGLLQERFVEVIPAPLGPDAALLSEGSCVDGVTAPGVSDLLSTTAEVLGDLDEAAQSMRLVFADAELLATFKSSLLSFSEAARAAVELAERASALTEASHELIVSGLEDIRGAAEDVHAVSEEIRTRLVGGEVMVDVEETAAQASEAAANLADATEAVAELLTDPEVKVELRETVAAIHAAAQSAKQIGEDLEVLSTELREAAPAVPKVVEEVEEMAATSAEIRERLKPPQMDAAFDVVYSGEENRSFSSAWVDIAVGRSRFLRLGVDDIGEESDANVQVGERVGRGAFRYGIIRSELGIGIDYDPGANLTLTLDVYDPNDIQADFLTQLPFATGRWHWSALAGVRDIGADDTVVAGVRLMK